MGLGLPAQCLSRWPAVTVLSSQEPFSSGCLLLLVALRSRICLFVLETQKEKVIAHYFLCKVILIAAVDRYLIDSQALPVLFLVLSSPGVSEAVGQI